ncbi:hypothetical protein SprV_0502012500 [Sparganum proliferum]
MSSLHIHLVSTQPPHAGFTLPLVPKSTIVSPYSFIAKQNQRVGSKVSATNLPGRSSPGRTFYVCDNQSGRPFLVDTGQQLDVLPPTAAKRRHPNLDLFLQAVSASPMNTFGTYSLSQDTSSQHLFT